MIVVIVGAVKAADAVKIVREHFEDWHNPNSRSRATLPDLAFDCGDAPRLRVAARQNPVRPGAGLPGPSRFSPDYQAASLANSVLGQFGMMGRIGRERARGTWACLLCLQPGRRRLRSRSLERIAGVNPANVDLAIDRIRDEIRRLVSEPVSEEDLATIRRITSGICRCNWKATRASPSRCATWKPSSLVSIIWSTTAT